MLECVSWTRRIATPEHCINPSIMTANGRMMFFARQWIHTLYYNITMAGWLDVETGRVSNTRYMAALGQGAEDVRVFQYDGGLWIAYTERKYWLSGIRQTMNIARIREHNGTWFIAAESVRELIWQGQTTPEKNWAPWEYQGRLFFSYSQTPHCVLQCDPETGQCVSVANGDLLLEGAWDAKRWGELRGGTPAVRFGADYLCVLHSTKQELKSWSKSYYICAALIEGREPWRIRYISAPIHHPDFYSVPQILLPHRVLFPCGLVLREDDALVSYGENDACCKLMSLDLVSLLRGMRKVS